MKKRFTEEQIIGFRRNAKSEMASPSRGAMAYEGNSRTVGDVIQCGDAAKAQGAAHGDPLHASRAVRLPGRMPQGDADQIENRHCERSEAIQNVRKIDELWIATALRASR